MKKILIVSTVSRQFFLFEQSNIETLHSLGYEVHTAANFSDANERLDNLNIIRHHFDIQRSPFSIENIKAYKQLIQIMKEHNFDAVHCHSPMGGVLARLAAKSVGIKCVIYTAHGFHFFKGAPLKNWLLYYPIERILARFSNILITLNHEDYRRANKFKAGFVRYIPGIGVNTSLFKKCCIDRAEKRSELGIPENATVLLSVGELIKRKNHIAAIRALAKLGDPHFFYIICGHGKLESYLLNAIQSLRLKKQVMLLGFRSDISEILSISDIFVFPSFQEGLPVALMEAMAVGLPVVCSNIRGNTDLIENGKGGFLCHPKDVEGITKAIRKIADDENLRRLMQLENQRKICNFDIKKVTDKMSKLYSEI